MTKTLKSLTRTVAFGVLSLGATLFATSSANATYDDWEAWDVEADAGSFGPVVLGESISLDACGSTLTVVQDRSFATSLCNVVNIALFSVEWFAVNIDTGDFQWLTTNFGTDVDPDLDDVAAGSAASNLQTTVNTGSGTFFSSIGTYAIGVYVSGTNDAEISETVSNGSTSFTPNLDFRDDFDDDLDDVLRLNGRLNNGADWGSEFALTAASSPPTSVPEPIQLLLLLPALLMIVRRERKRLA